MKCCWQINNYKIFRPGETFSQWWVNVARKSEGIHSNIIISSQIKQAQDDDNSNNIVKCM